jgi:hypothetical protein
MAELMLPDRHAKLFGRAEDLQRLQARAWRKGVTAVVARPQMGKSWVLTELARRLTEDQYYLVGFAESFGEGSDLWLRAVSDLYQRWLGNATYWEQARTVWDQQKQDWLPAFAKVFGKIIGELPGLAKPAGVAIQEAIEGLVAANQTLQIGGLKLPTLQYEQARDLVKSVAEVSGRNIVLFFDAWEQSKDPRFEAKTLAAFLSHADDWPDCHVFLALRPDDPAYEVVETLARAHPAAQLYLLHEMNLDEPDERHRLLNFLHEQVPATERTSQSTVIDLIGGYPGVIYRWTSEDQASQMTSGLDLRRVADDAQNYRFHELESLLRVLQGDQATLAIRVALVPVVAAPLRNFVIAGLSEDAADDLKLGKVLESADPPSYGHLKRLEAARAWLLGNRPAAVRGEGTVLISRLAQSVTDLDARHMFSAAALRELANVAHDKDWGAVAVALCQAASSLLDHSASASAMISGARTARSLQSFDAAPLLAIGLANTLAYAKAEEDLPRRDALLDELRALSAAYPAEAAVREPLANGLFNTLIHAKAAEDLPRRDALLDELRALSAAYPAEAAVREWLAMGLVNTLNDAKAEEDLPRRDALLDELRALHAAYPAEAAVREWLAKGLFNTLNHAKAEEDLPRRDALLDELRALHAAYPAEAAVREWLAKGLFNTLIEVEAEDNLPRRNALLDELRALCEAYPAIRGWLPRGFFDN